MIMMYLEFEVARGDTDMEPIYLSIRQKEPGNTIRTLLMEEGYTVRDVQEVRGFENPQAVYKWLSGRSLPSLDNLLILSKLLHISMEEILVVDGDFHLRAVTSKRLYLHKILAIAV